MISSRNPKGREPGTHSEDLNFKKVAREPNRFEIVFSFRKFQDANEPDVASHRSVVKSAQDHILAAFETGYRPFSGLSWDPS
jgi:hypothetical protein